MKMRFDVRALLVYLAASMIMCGVLFAQSMNSSIRVTLVGFADRWADYGSRGDTPGWRDFLGVLRCPREKKCTGNSFVKVRMLYWGEGKSDPRKLADAEQVERTFTAKRESSCDETFEHLSHQGDVNYLDPKLRPSRFVRITGNINRLPALETTLPCYQVE